MVTYGFVHLLLEILNMQNSLDSLVFILYAWNWSPFSPLYCPPSETGVQAWPLQSRFGRNEERFSNKPVVNSREALQQRALSL
jgi:hypothetical protein